MIEAVIIIGKVSGCRRAVDSSGLLLGGLLHESIGVFCEEAETDHHAERADNLVSETVEDCMCDVEFGLGGPADDSDLVGKKAEQPIANLLHTRNVIGQIDLNEPGRDIFVFGSLRALLFLGVSKRLLVRYDLVLVLHEGDIDFPGFLEEARLKDADKVGLINDAAGLLIDVEIKKHEAQDGLELFGEARLLEVGEENTLREQFLHVFDASVVTVLAEKCIQPHLRLEVLEHDLVADGLV